jgi:hypothetical protein
MPKMHVVVNKRYRVDVMMAEWSSPLFGTKKSSEEANCLNQGIHTHAHTEELHSKRQSSENGKMNSLRINKK